jgi:carbonic anhydrase
MSSLDELVARARASASKPSAPVAPEPRLRTLILTCMDARIDPVTLFGLVPGDVHVLRNAGARATPDVLRSVALSQAILGTREVLVLGHTGCGLNGRTEAELAEEIRFKSGRKPGMELGAFHDLDQAVGETVDALRRCSFLTYRDRIGGFVYTLDDGSIRPVEAADATAARAAGTSPLSGLDALRADVLDLNKARKRSR